MGINAGEDITVGAGGNANITAGGDLNIAGKNIFEVAEEAFETESEVFESVGNEISQSSQEGDINFKSKKDVKTNSSGQSKLY